MLSKFPVRQIWNRARPQLRSVTRKSPVPLCSFKYNHHRSSQKRMDLPLVLGIFGGLFGQQRDKETDDDTSEKNFNPEVLKNLDRAFLHMQKGMDGTARKLTILESMAELKISDSTWAVSQTDMKAYRSQLEELRNGFNLLKEKLEHYKQNPSSADSDLFEFTVKSHQLCSSLMNLDAKLDEIFDVQQDSVY